MKNYKLNNYQLGKLNQFGIEYTVVSKVKNNIVVELDTTDSNVATFVRINNIKESN